ncbi:hypothetical protein KI387_019977, partial [Taxus chinensis]
QDSEAPLASILQALPSEMQKEASAGLLDGGSLEPSTESALSARLEPERFVSSA